MKELRLQVFCDMNKFFIKRKIRKGRNADMNCLLLFVAACDAYDIVVKLIDCKIGF